MGLSYEQVMEWFSSYFASVNSHQGRPEDVVELRKWFSPDFQFMMHTAPDFIKPPLGRKDMLMIFVHPGLTEHLVPQHFVVDLTNNRVVVHFEARFVDDISGRKWEPMLNSAHYQLDVDDDTGSIQIKRIDYWTESEKPGRDYGSLYEFWGKVREEALVEYVQKSF